MIPIGETAHVRTVRAEVRRVSEHELEITGRLVDERPRGTDPFDRNHEGVVHDMTLVIRVRHPEMVITAVEGRMDHRPYTLCTDAVPPLQQLVGLPVMKGFTRAVNERFGRQLGCSHLGALIHAMAPAIKQGAGAIWLEDEDTGRPDQDVWFVNTCQAWRENGPLHAGVKRGGIEALRIYSARRSTGDR
jgi:hypothetical protein